MQLSGAGSFKPPTKTKLTKESKVGEYVSWTINARTYEGILDSWDSNTATIKLKDGRIKHVEC